MQVQVKSLNQPAHESTELTPNSPYHKIATAVVTTFTQMTSGQPLISQEIEKQLELSEQIDQKEINAFSILDKTPNFASFDLLTLKPFANIHLETETSGVNLNKEEDTKTELEKNPKSDKKKPFLESQTDTAVSIVATHLKVFQRQHPNWASDKINELIGSLEATQKLEDTFQAHNHTFQNKEIYKQASEASIEKEEAELLATLLSNSSIKIDAQAVAQTLIKHKFSKLKDLTVADLSKKLNIDKQLATQLADFFKAVKVDYVLIGAWVIKKVLGHCTSDLSLMRSASQLYIDLFENAKTIDLSKNAKTHETHLKQFANRLKALMTADYVKNLRVGERYVRRGRYQGRPGHAFLDIYVRRADGNFDVYIFNTGAGTEYHPFLKDNAKGKSRIQPVIKFENVLPSELCLSKDPRLFSPIFFENLIALANPLTEHTITPADIYDKAFGHLVNKRAVVNQDLAGFMSAQRAGNCTTRVSEALVRDTYLNDSKIHGKNLAFYKRWKHQFKFDTLIAFYQKNKKIIEEDTPQADSIRLSLIKAAKEFHTHTHKLCHDDRTGLLTQPEAMQAYCTTKELQARLATIENRIDTLRKQKSHKLEWEQKELAAVSVESTKKIASFIQKQAQQIESFSKSTVEISSLAPLPVSSFSFAAKKLGQSLGVLVAHIDKMKKQDCAGAIFQIEEIVRSIPFSSRDYWSGIPSEERALCLEHLNSLMSTYGELNLQPTCTFPERQNTALSLLAMIHGLALVVDDDVFSDEGQLKNYGIHIHPFLMSITDPFLVTFEPETFAQRQKLLAYFKHKSKNLLFNFSKYEVRRDGFSSTPEVKYYLQFVNTVPGFKDKLNEEVKKFQSVNPARFTTSTIDALKAIVLLSPAERHTISGHQQHDLLDCKELKHLAILRNATFMAQLFCGCADDNNRTEKLKIKTFACDNDPCVVLFYYGNDNNIKLTPHFITDLPARKNHRLNHESYDELVQTVKSPSFERDRISILSEGNVVVSFKSDALKKIKCDKLLAATNVKPHLQQTKLLYYFCQEHHLDDLREPESQTLFDLLFFKPTFEVVKNEHYKPIDILKEDVSLFDSTVMNEQLMHQCAEFLNQGITHFYLRQLDGKPVTYACLFFIRLNQRLQAVYPNAKLPNLNTYLNEWLKNPELTPKEKSAIHLHRMHQYLSFDPDKINTSMMKEILTSWFYYSGEPLDPQWIEPQMEMRIRQFLYSLAPHIEKLLQDLPIRQQLFCEIFNICDLENLTGNSLQWQANENGSLTYYLKQKNGMLRWEINLLTGTIADPSGIVQRGDCKAISTEDYYKRLFKEEQFSVKKTGIAFYFKHPLYGPIRILQKKTERKINYELSVSNIIIQRQQINGVTGEWHQFVMPDELMESRLFPLPLLADHSAWLNNDQISFCDLHSGRLQAVASQGGLFLASNGWKQLLSLPEQLFAAPSIDVFDNKYWLLCSLEKNKINQICFTRYGANNASSKGQSLTFQFKEHSNEPVWMEDVRFSLSEHQPKGLLGRIPEYLVLHENTQTRNPKRKILVPMRPILGNSHYHRHIHIDVETGKKQGELLSFRTDYTDSDVMRDQAGVYHYLEYDLEGTQVKPLSTEGVLYLSYMHLCERNYETTFSLLNTLSSSTSLSKESLEILNWMLTVKKQADSSPDASAIRLHLLLFISSLNERPKQKTQNALSQEEVAKEQQKLKDRILDTYHRYLDILNTVSQSLRLSREQEQQIIEVFGIDKKDAKNNDSACVNRKVVLGTSHPLEKIKPTSSHDQFCITTKPLLGNRLDHAIEWSTTFKEYRILQGQHPYFRSNQEDWLKNLQFDVVGNDDSLQQLFGELFTLARRDWKDHERYALQLNFAFMQGNLSYNELYGYMPPSLIFNLLHCALLYPKEVPELPQQSATEEDKIKWLTAIAAFYVSKQSKGTELTKHIPVSPKITQVDLQMPQRHLLLTVPPQETHMTKQEDDQDLIAAKSLSESALAPLHLNGLAKAYFSVTRQLLEAPLLEFEISKNEISRDEQLYYPAINMEMESFRKEYLAGRTKNEERRTYKLEGSLSNLKQSLLQGKNSNTPLKGLTALEHETKQLEKLILNLANKKSEDEQKRLLENTLQGGNFSQPYSIEQIKTFLLLKGNCDAFKKINPLLSDEEIRSLRELVLIYTINSAELKQGKRILGLIEEAEAEIANKCSGEKIRSLTSDIAQTLHAKMHYSPSKHPEFLVFEERAGIRLRKRQVELLEELLELNPKTQKYKDVVKQLLMGEGKTAVLTPLLLFIAAKKRKIATYIGPPAQFNSVKQNLLSTQKEYFGQDVIAIDLAREDFNEKNLQWMLTQLQEGIQNKENALLIKQTTIQSLFLQLVFLTLNSQKQKEQLNDIQLKTVSNEIFLLKQILKTYTENSDVIKDEPDLLLDENFEVNFPYGSPSKLNPGYVELFSAIYDLLISHLRVNGKSINEIIQLRSNKQTDIPQVDYKEKILPVVLEALAKHFIQLNIPEKFIPSFQRFAMGLLKSGKLEPIDEEFLKYVKTLHLSVKPREIMAANLISLCKHLFRDILPFTLNRSTNRNYGRAGFDAAPGKICPYRGVDTPSSNEFISPWIAAAYHFQTALFQGISTEQLRAIATMAAKAAQHYCQKEKIPFDHTVEAIEFRTITGVQLSTINQPGNLKKATDYLNQNTTRILHAEAETVCSVVTSYPKHLSSNAQDAVAFDNTERAFSGTPYNAVGYAERLRKNTHLDIGTSGQIIDEMLRRVVANPFSIHVVDEVTVDSIFKQAAQSPRKERIRGIVDPAGLFRNEKDNLEVARQLLEQFKGNNQIEYVLFFGRRDPKGLPDDLMILKKGFREPSYVGVTKKEKLAEKGINPMNACFFIDERHCEGTDLPFPIDALFLMTLDEKLNIRTVGQTVLRERGYFNQQDIEYVVRKKALPLFLGPVVKIYHEMEALRVSKPDDLHTMGQLAQKLLKYCILTFAKNEAITKSIISFTAFKHKLDQALRQKGFHSLLQAPDDIDILGKISSNFESVFITNTVEDPFVKYFEEEDDVPSLAALKAYYDKKIVQLKKITNNEETIKSITEEMDVIMVEANNCGFLPETVSTLANGDQLDNEQVIELELNQDKEQALELDLDMRQELDQYSQYGHETVFQEKAWNDKMVSEDFPKIPPAINNSILNHSPAIYPLFKLLSSTKETQVKYQHEYSKIFDQNISISRNLALTAIFFHPVFNPLQKLANQILVVAKDEKLSFIMLSIQDADFFKDYLCRLQPRHMWLILPDGHEISFHKHIGLTKDLADQYKRALVQVNLFNGNAAYLDLTANQKVFESYLKEKDSHLKLRFLRLKVESDQAQKQIFSRNPLMNTEGGKFNGPGAHLARYKQMRLEEESFENITEEELHALPEHKIPLLDGKKIPLLKKTSHIQALEAQQLRFIQPSQISQLTAFQIAYLTEKEQINAVSVEFMEYLEHAQLKLLTPERIQLLPPEIFLSDRFPNEQICNLCLTQLRQLKDPNQFDWISPKQVSELEDRQLQCLSNSDLIQAIPIDKLCYISNHQLSKISPEQLGHLEPEKVGWLTDKQLQYLQTPQQIQAVNNKRLEWLTRKQYAHLSKSQIENIEPEKVSWLENSQIKYLKTPKQVQSVPDDALQYLEAEEGIQAIAPERVRFLPHEHQLYVLIPLQILSLIPVQIEKIKPDQLIHLSNRQIQSVLPSYVAHLDNSKLCYLDTIAQIQAVSTSRLTHLKREQYARLSKLQIENIEPEKVQWLSNDQIKHLKTPEQIQQLPSEALQYLETEEGIKAVSPERVRFLPHDQQIQALTDKQLTSITPVQIAKIKPEQVTHLDKSQLKHLPPTHVAHVPDSDLSYLTNVEQIQAVDNSRLEKLERRQYAHFSKSQIEAIAPEKVEWLRQNQIKYLKTPQQIEHVSDNSLQYLEQLEAIQAVAPERVGCLPHEQQIQALIPLQIAQLTPVQIAKLKSEQLVHLGKTQIKHVSPAHVTHLSDSALCQLESREQIQEIQDDKLDNLVPEQFPHLSRSQIEHLKPPQLIHLAKDQLHHVSPVHVPFLSNEDLFRLESIEQIQAVDSSKLNWLEQGQYAHLSISQIGNVEPDKVSWLNGSHVKHLKTPDQIQKVTTQQLPFVTFDQIPHLTPKQIGCLNSRAQVEKVDVSNIKHLQNTQIPLISNAQIPYLLPEQVPLLSITQIDHLDNAQIKFLTSKAHIQHMGMGKLIHLQKSQFEHLSDTQLNGFPVGRVSELDLKLLRKITTPLLIQAIPTKHVTKLEKNQLSHLGNHQLKFVPKRDYRHLKTAQLKGYYSKTQALCMIVTGFFWNIVRIVACVTVVYFLKYAAKSCRQVFDKLDQGCDDLRIGFRVIC